MSIAPDVDVNQRSRKTTRSPFAAEIAGLHDDLTAYHHYLQSERGLAKNSLLAYGRDLNRFATFCAEGHVRDYLQVNLHELGNYLGYLREQGLAPPSAARHLVALKTFYRF